jgi:hypothetical protein
MKWGAQTNNIYFLCFRFHSLMMMPLEDIILLLFPSILGLFVFVEFVSMNFDDEEHCGKRMKFEHLSVFFSFSKYFPKSTDAITRSRFCLSTPHHHTATNIFNHHNTLHILRS